MEPIRILLAEDQLMMRSALSALLGLEPDLLVVAEVGRGDEVVEAAVASQAQVAVLDIEMPGRSGLDVIAELLSAVPGIAILMVTTFGRPGHLRRALDAGARGFVVKDDPVEELSAAIRRVLAGETVVNPVLAAQSLRAGPNPLTAREQDALAAGEGGATIADVAASLQLSNSTVRNYLSSAIGKTGARNRTEALTLARERGWL